MLYPSLSFRNSQYLLDTYPPIAAYSLRQLKAGVTSVVRVRRDSDNSEQDFTAAEITNGTMAAWIGANNGFVTIWYDQGGNGYNAVQATQANQPKIHDSSTGLVLENGKPAIDWGNSTNDKHLKVSPYNNSYYGTFGVGKYTGLSPFTDFRGILTSTFSAPQDLTILTNSLGTWYADTSIEHYLNGGAESPTALPAIQSQFLIHTNTPTAGNKAEFWIGTDRAFPARGWLGTLQELILYSSDQSSNRATIEGNINGYYGIY